MSKFKVGDRVVPAENAIDISQSNGFKARCFKGGYLSVRRVKDQGVICIDRLGFEWYCREDEITLFNKEPTRPDRYITVPKSITPGGEIDWKKAFEMLKEYSLLTCYNENRKIVCTSIMIPKILNQCTKGGE